MQSLEVQSLEVQSLVVLVSVLMVVVLKNLDQTEVRLGVRLVARLGVRLEEVSVLKNLD